MLSSASSEDENAFGLLLPGGGARAAFQVGVLKGIAAILPQTPLPCPVVCGTSAGAINAVALATRAADFGAAVRWLEQLWLQLESHHVYRSDWAAVALNSLRLMLSVVTAGRAVPQPVALLDNEPLRELLGREMRFEAIADHLRDGHLKALAVTAINYTRGSTVTFFQGGPQAAGWKRWRRHGIPQPIELPQLMASTAIPTLFPAEPIGGQFYGDGALRQLTPISPALHLGARRVLVIPPNGHRRDYARKHQSTRKPAFGEIIGHLLNSAFVDNLETDLEMLERLNELLNCIPPELQCQVSAMLRPIETLIISPSDDIDEIAREHVGNLPRSVRTFLRLSGSGRNAGNVNLASYLLFTRSYIEALMAMGYRDALDRRDEITAFFAPSRVAVSA